MKNVSVGIFVLLCSASWSTNLSGQFLPPIEQGNLRIELETVVLEPFLNSPLHVTHAKDGSNRVFVVDKFGEVKILQYGNLWGPPFLDLTSEVYTPGARGLLGLTFHPGFSDPQSLGFHKLYTYHSVAVDEVATVDFPAPGTIFHHNLLTEWQVSASDPNLVDGSTRRDIFREAHPGDVHSGGGMDWGPDGYLYVSIGTPLPLEAQNLGNVLGTILRIDPIDPALTPESADPVSPNGRYRIPESNPFLNDPLGQDDIFAYGLRHPYRFSFDSETGLLFTADVGQSTAEEVDVVVAGGNYGWPYREGSLPGPIPTPFPPPTMIGPIADYNSDVGEGRAVIGGFVYRGSAIPELVGKYVFADLTRVGQPFGEYPGRLFWIDPYDEAGQLKDASEVEIKEFIIGLSGDDPGASIFGMGTDEQGEIYIVGISTVTGQGGSGIVRKIVRFVPLFGDMDCDGDVDFDDIEPFVLGLNDPVAYENTYGVPASMKGDIDQDSDLDFDDIDDFVDLLRAPVSDSLSNVPEPSALVLAVSCALVLMRRVRYELCIMVRDL